MKSLDSCRGPMLARDVNRMRRASPGAARRTRVRVSTDAVVSAYVQEIAHGRQRSAALRPPAAAARDTLGALSLGTCSAIERPESSGRPLSMERALLRGSSPL